MHRICQAISEATPRSTTQQAVEEIVAQLNRQLIGWANYFCLGPVSKAYRAVEGHTRRRLRQWLCAKHKRKEAGTKQYSDQLLHDQFGLVRLSIEPPAFRGQNRDPFSESWMLEMGLSNSMSGKRNQDHVKPD